jgi:two-component system sensor histidine kinase PilS (NtrC family)
LTDRDALSWLFLSRLLLVLALLLMLSFEGSADWLPRVAEPSGARQLLLVQTAVILLSGLMTVIGWPRRDQQVQLAVFLDSAFAVLLIHLSGGVAAGFGLLPVVPLTWGALLLAGRQSLLFAALASLGVISVQVHAELYLDGHRGSYLEAGLLGLVYFSVAMLAHGLSKRLQASERRVARREIDVADLSKLNDYVIQQLSIGVLVIDGERRIRLSNAAAQQILQGSSWRRGVALGRAAPPLLDWLERMVAGEPVAGRIIQLNGHSLRPSLHLLGHNRPHGALIYLRDEQEMLRQAQAMNLASVGRLSASVAHNIRNPLAAISHAGQLLAESQHLDTEDQRLLAIIQRNTQRLDETVASVLDLANRHRAEPHRLELNGWLDAFCSEYRETNGLAGHELILQLPERTLEVHADSRHLQQILSNLCDNARLHGCDGAGRCSIHLALDRGADNRVQLRLSDQGPGIPPDLHEAVFEPFFTTASSGTGLGLYAARALAESNGMRLAYSEQRHAGACFRLTFAAHHQP